MKKLIFLFAVCVTMASCSFTHQGQHSAWNVSVGGSVGGQYPQQYPQTYPQQQQQYYYCPGPYGPNPPIITTPGVHRCPQP